MADSKNKNFYVKNEIKSDKRLTDILLRMKVIDDEDIEARISGLKDSEGNQRVVSLEDISKNQNN